MLQPNECKFSLSNEVRWLWEDLKRTGKEEKFQILFWETVQGQRNMDVLKQERKRPTKVTIEQREKDLSPNVYIEYIELM